MALCTGMMPMGHRGVAFTEHPRMDDGGGAGLAIDEHSMGASTDSDNDSKIRRSSISSNRSRSRTNSRRALRRRAAAGVGTMHVPASERVEQLGESLLHRCIDQVMQPIKRKDFSQRIELPGEFSELSFEDQLAVLDGMEAPMVSQVSRRKEHVSHDPAQRKELRVMCEHLKGNHSTFEICRLNDENIDDELVSQIARSLRFNVYLQCLQLNNNRITDEGVKELCRAIRGHPTLHTIRLGNNYLSDVSVNAFSALMEKNHVLRDLNLTNKWPPKHKDDDPLAATKAFHPFISSSGADKLASMLTRGCSLTALSLHDQRILDAGAIAIFHSLPKSKLLKLNIGSNQISDAASGALGACLSDPSCTLIELIMDGNNLADASAQELSLCFATNETLVTLDLTSNRINSPGMQALASGLLRNRALGALLVRGNPGDTNAVEKAMELRDSMAPGSAIPTSRSGASTPMASSGLPPTSPGAKSPLQRQLLMTPNCLPKSAVPDGLVCIDDEVKIKKMRERRLERIQANNRRFNSTQSRNLLRDLATLHGTSNSLPSIRDGNAEPDNPGTAKSSWQRYLDSHSQSLEHNAQNLSLRMRDKSGFNTLRRTSMFSGPSTSGGPVDASFDSNTKERIGLILDANKPKARLGADLGKALGVPQLTGLKGSAVVRSGISHYQDTSSNSLYLRVAIPSSSATGESPVKGGDSIQEDMVPMSLLQIDINRRAERERVRLEHQGDDYKEFKYLCMFYGDRARLEESIQRLPPDNFWRKDWKQQIQLRYPNGIDEFGSERYKERVSNLEGPWSPSRSRSRSPSRAAQSRNSRAGHRDAEGGLSGSSPSALGGAEGDSGAVASLYHDVAALPKSLTFGDPLADSRILAAVDKRMARDMERRQHARRTKRLNRFAYQKPKPISAPPQDLNLSIKEPTVEGAKS